MLGIGHEQQVPVQRQQRRQRGQSLQRQQREATTYVTIERIGQGVYGTVYKVRDERTGSIHAMKKTTMDPEGTMATTMREISILKALKHDNIVSIHDVCIANHSDKQVTVNIVMDYAYTDLAQHIAKSQACRQPTPFNESTRRFFYEILDGLAYAHALRIVHRDLKPSNILIWKDPSGRDAIKIADFGLSRQTLHLPGPATPDTVTMLYRAPEIFCGVSVYSQPVDLWSCGCILAEMARGRPLFSGDNEISLLKDIGRKLGPMSPDDIPDVSKDRDGEYMILTRAGPPEVSLDDLLGEFLESSGLDLVKELLVYNPARRLTVFEALHHPYLASLRRPAADADADKKDA
ncbi:kinase-like domain-containing protein [Entophlyctis helioformis]|nr:kinase-like domain-containing protein [Entophlyctis helioformis]